MATVFLAHDLRHDRDVAIKVLHPDLGAALGGERFLSEIRTTARLQHPHVLPLLDSGSADGLLYYVMPLITGETLRARLAREKQLPVDDAVRIAVAVAHALDYAHAHNIIHRDLKPENLLLQHGQPIIADFGIALAMTRAGGQRITQSGISLGTPQYMSPEQATGERAIDARTDIYSLAAITYEMLVGEPPHTGTSTQAVIAKLLTEEPSPIGVLRRSVPANVQYAVRRGMEKIPADRFATARAFADALEGAAVLPTEIVVTGARPDAAPSVAMRPMAGAKWLGSPAVTIGALVIAAVAVAGWVSARRHTEPALSTLRFALDMPAGLHLAPPVSLGGSPIAVSFDGNTIAAVALGGDTLRHIVVRSLRDAHVRALPGTQGASVPFFSPDGKWIAFIADQRLKKTPVVGGEVTTLTEPLAREQFGGTWGAGDKIVLSVGGQLVTVPSAGGALAPLDVGDSTGRGYRWPRFLADGKTLLFVKAPPGVKPQIGVTSMDGGKPTALDPPALNALGVIDGQLIYAVNETVTGELMAVPFDVKSRRVTGTPRRVLDVRPIGVWGYLRGDLSPAGTLVYESGSGASEAVLADFNGQTKPFLPQRQNYGYGRFSPDGKRLVYTVLSGTSSVVWVYDVASRTPTVLTTASAPSDRPEWTPDGKRVLYRSSGVQSMAGLWWRAADASDDAVPLLAPKGVEVWEGVFTKSGRLVYRTGTGEARIWVRRMSGDTTAVKLTSGEHAEWAPRPSPDEKLLAYSSDVSGTWQVYVRPLDALGSRVQVSVDGGDSPVWSHDGHRLFYIANGRQVMAASIGTAPALAVSSRATLFEGDFNFLRAHASYDVAPDDKHLLVFRNAGDVETLIAYNWGAELRASTKH
jgi:serine/threonine-protein kinase